MDILIQYILKTFILIKLSELLREPLFTLESTTENYQIIQQQQLFINKFTHNYQSKFIFYFISAKIFLEQTI